MLQPVSQQFSTETDNRPIEDWKISKEQTFNRGIHKFFKWVDKSEDSNKF